MGKFNKSIYEVPEIVSNTRLLNILIRAGISTIEDIIYMRTDELNRIRSFGPYLQKELQSILDKYGIVRIDQENFNEQLLMDEVKSKQSENEELLQSKEYLIKKRNDITKNIELKQSLLKEIENNKREIEILKKRNEEINRELLTMLTNEEIIRGIK